MSNFDTVRSTVLSHLDDQIEAATEQCVQILGAFDPAQQSPEWALRCAACKARLETLKSLAAFLDDAFDDFTEDPNDGWSQPIDHDDIPF